jgi:thiol-disulfide isomerase/thioredoxin
MIIIIDMKTLGAVQLMPYVSTACMLAKMGNVLLYFYSDPVYGVLYISVCLRMYSLLSIFKQLLKKVNTFSVHLLLLPEPSYEGPENVTYFRGSDLEEELERDKRTVWLIELYTTWSPPSIEFSSVFSEISAKYSLENLRFGKVDLARNAEIAQKYKINTSSLSKQLPTLILFRNGKEFMRRPLVNNSGKLVKFVLNYVRIELILNLNY